MYHIKSRTKSEDIKLAFSAWFQGTGLSACSNILVLCSSLLLDIDVLSFDNRKFTYWSIIAF